MVEQQKAARRNKRAIRNTTERRNRSIAVVRRDPLISTRISSSTRLVLQLVEEAVEGGNSLLETLALTGLDDDLAGLGGLIQGVACLDLPMIEHALEGKEGGNEIVAPTAIC